MRERWMGLDWIRYIRLSDGPESGSADLDAIAEFSPVPLPGAAWLRASGPDWHKEKIN